MFRVRNNIWHKNLLNLRQVNKLGIDTPAKCLLNRQCGEGNQKKT